MPIENMEENVQVQGCNSLRLFLVGILGFEKSSFTDFDQQYQIICMLNV